MVRSATRKINQKRVGGLEEGVEFANLDRVIRKYYYEKVIFG